MRHVALTVHSVPRFGRGKSLVRFLGSPRGILTHWGKGRPLACPGEELCAHHTVRAKWKGYAAGQVWIAADRLWVPHVIELSAGLIESTGLEDLQGTCWELFRVKRAYGDRAIEARLRHEYNPHDLPPAFCVERTVEALYGTSAILWDVPIDGYTRERAQCSDDAPPPAAAPATPPKEDYAAAAAKFKRDNAEHFPASNGRAKKTDR